MFLLTGEYPLPGLGITRRISSRRRIYFKYRELLKNKRIEMNLKKWIIKECIMSAVLMALIMGKKERQYEMIVGVVKDGWKRLNIKPEFKRIHLDYDVELQNRCKRLNGSDKVHGCIFHYTQNLIDQVLQLRLKDYYENKKRIKILWNECLSKGPNKPSDAKDWPESDLKK